MKTNMKTGMIRGLPKLGDGLIENINKLSENQLFSMSEETDNNFNEIAYLEKLIKSGELLLERKHDKLFITNKEGASIII